MNPGEGGCPKHGKGLPENSRQNRGGILGCRAIGDLRLWANKGHKPAAVGPGAGGSFSLGKYYRPSPL